MVLEVGPFNIPLSWGMVDYFVNGVAIIKTDPWTDANVLFSTDACLVGCGGLYDNIYFHSTFPP